MEDDLYIDASAVEDLMFAVIDAFHNGVVFKNGKYASIPMASAEELGRVARKAAVDAVKAVCPKPVDRIINLKTGKVTEITHGA
jgi:hypothetical protein